MLLSVIAEVILKCNAVSKCTKLLVETLFLVESSSPARDSKVFRRRHLGSAARRVR